MTRRIPHGRASLDVRFPADLEVEWVQPNYGRGAPDPAALLADRLQNPIAARPLADQARGARRVTIIIDDITRPTPSKQMLPAVLRELHSAGVEAGGIRVLVGVGSHRTMTPEEMETIVGPEIFARYQVLNHQARDPEHLVRLG